jgi:hypothetical protein
MNKKAVSGEALRRSWSGSTEHANSVRQVALLTAFGLAAVILHAGFHWPLKLPGHHGLEWMAILAFARCMSPLPWAASITAASAALFSTMPVWGFSEPLVALFYLLPGVVIDIGYRQAPFLRQSLLWLGVIAAIAHASKPMARYVIAILTDLQFGSLIGGLAFPLSTHLLFGFAGGVAGATAWRLMHKRR